MVKKIFLYTVQSILLLKDLFLLKFFNKKNSEKSYQFFILLFCLTGGLTNRLFNSFLSYPLRPFRSQTYLHIFSKIDKKLVVNQLKNLGHFSIKDALSEQSIENIKLFLTNTLGTYRSDKYSSKEKEEFDYSNPKAVTFHYDKNDIIENQIVQKLAIDKNIVDIVGNYFGKFPILDSINTWWTLPSNQADMTSAQAWHFDLDRTKWIKIFIYLTDCSEKNGPHYFIQKSHRDNGIPFDIRKRGYKRIEQNLIDKHYNQDDIKMFTANKGSLLFEDTRGMHKGQRVEIGSRLILILQYTTNLFGHEFLPFKFPKNSCKEMIECRKQNPILFKNFIN